MTSHRRPCDNRRVGIVTKDSGGRDRAEASGTIADGAPKVDGPEPVVDNEGYAEIAGRKTAQRSLLGRIPPEAA